MKAEKGFKNLIAVIVSQLVTMVLGFLIPRITLLSYGSETNGFMSLVSQIYIYVGLLEAGLGTAMVQALYAPITTNNRDEISGIISAAKRYYNRIAAMYAGVVVLISVLLPCFLKSELSRWEITFYFLFFGVSNVINFIFTASMKPILQADGKNYVTNNITLIFHVFSQFAKILLLSLAVNIVVLQFFYSVINILQVVVYYVYFKKKYSWIDKKAKPLFDNIKQRGSLFAQQISRLFFSCVDIIIISLFFDLKTVSVYTTYLLIFDSIGRILSMISTSTQFILAQLYNENREKYIPVHRGYESVFVTVSFVAYSVAFVLVLPFIKLYTEGVTDASYINMYLPILFTLIGLFTTFKTVPLGLINFTYHAKQTLNRTISEAAINFVLSIIFAMIFGMWGVLLATCIALVYRVVDSTIYINRKILNASVFQNFKLYIVNLIAFVAIVYAMQFVSFEFSNYLEFIFAGGIITVALMVYYVTINALIDIKQAKMIFNILKKKVLKR